ncbi:hypothetical protein Scep_021407 [Stephania cephalantha]|uniref:Uncharacterized protein n=1 Tax=Stephania cephalantha TaxID=152367 RepID=A0AAP0HWU2_9MAGN
MSKSAPWQVPLARARPRLAVFIWYGQGRAWHSFGMSSGRACSVPGHEQGNTLANSFGTSKVVPWHEQGRSLARQSIPWQGLAKLDSGVDQVKVRLVSFLDVSYWSSRNGLTSTIKRGVSSPRGGMGIEARKTLEYALGNHAKARPTDPWSEPPRAGGTRPSPG